MKSSALVAFLVLFALAPLFAHAAPAVSISLNPATGVAPYPSTLTWSATGAASCTASDGWTGTQAASGTKQVTITAATKFTLTCTANDGQTVTTWTPPTTNADGSPLSDLAGFSIYRGTTTTNLAKVKALGPTVTSFTDTGLASGQYYYQVTATDSGSLESVRAQSTPYPISVQGSSTAASATAGLQSPPSAPTGVITTSVSVNVSVTTGAAPSP